MKLLPTSLKNDISVSVNLRRVKRKIVRMTTLKSKTYPLSVNCFDKGSFDDVKNLAAFFYTAEADSRHTMNRVAILTKPVETGSARWSLI